MLAFHDMTEEVSERSTDRMGLRMKPRVKATIQKAAALSGVDDSAFTQSAAYEKAMQTISAHEQTFLKAPDHKAFFAALDNPPMANENMRAAFARHRRTVTRK